MRKLFSLGGESDSMAFLSRPDMVGDSRGQFTLLTYARTLVRVDSTGRVIGRITRKGKGPGEIERPVALIRIPGDSLRVFDVANGLQLFDPQLKYVDRSYPRFMGSTDQTLFSLADGSVAHSAEGDYGLPAVNIYSRGGNLESSIFVDSSRSSQGNPVQNRRHLTVMSDSGDCFWATEAIHFRLEHWCRSGRKQTLIRPHPAFDIREDYLRSFVMVIDRYAPHQLWVQYTIANDPNMRFGQIQGKRTEPESLYHTIVEVIDPLSGRLIVNRTIPGLLALRHQAGGTIMLTRRVDVDGSNILDVWRLTLIRPRH